MLDKNQLKNDGLLFGRNLHKALKIASMYASVDHSAVDMAAQQTYASLSPLLKQTSQFTLGFMNQRLLLNNVLTGENPLIALEVEFTKRGIGAVTFEAGITLREFRRGLALLSTAPRALEKSGGLKRLLEQNPFERMRIVPVSKTRDESGDTMLSLGSESYLLAQAILEPQAGREDSNLDPLLQLAEVNKLAALPGSGGEIRALAGNAIQQILEDPERDLKEAVRTLTRLFDQLTPDYLLASLTPAKQNELRGHSGGDLATDLVEDITVEVAGKRLAGAPQGPLDPSSLEDVMRILVRGLKATHVAERLLKKLARFIEEAKLPAEINDRIRQELVWFSLSEPEKHARLLRLERFDTREFRHLVNYVHDRMKDEGADRGLEVTGHYFACVDKAPADVAVEHMMQVPELVGAMAGPDTAKFLRGVADQLCPRLLDKRSQPGGFHRQVANCLISVAQSAALYEDFELVQRIGVDLQNCLGKDSAQHAECCGRALEGLLSSSAADRVLELFLENRDDANWTKIAANLLRVAEKIGGEKAFERLAEEPAASNRLRLIRLIEQLGPSAIEAARKRLGDDRWYVVRNACYLMGRLADPELSSRLVTGLHHPEVRVQQAAVTAIIRNQVSNCAEVLAEALPHLKGEVLDIVLEELTFLKDPAAVESLERFISQKENSKARTLENAVRVLGAIRTDRAAEILSGILSDTAQAQSVRRAALIALSCHPSPHAHRLMYKFSRLDPKDALVQECQTLLEGTST